MLKTGVGSSREWRFEGCAEEVEFGFRRRPDVIHDAGHGEYYLVYPVSLVARRMSCSWTRSTASSSIAASSSAASFRMVTHSLGILG